MENLFTTILHDKRKEFNLTILEYCLLDSIYHLSKRKGFCYKSKKSFGEFLGISERQVYNILNKLEDKGMIRRDENKHIYPTKFICSVYEKISQPMKNLQNNTENFAEGTENIAEETLKKFQYDTENISYYNNNTYTDNNSDINNNNDFSKNFTNDEYKEIFDIARKNYPGSKRGLEVEYNNFIKKEKEWKKYIFELNNSIEKYKEYIKAKNMQNYIKNFTTWINQADYTMEYPEIEKQNSNYELFKSKFKDYELNLSKELDNLIKHFLTKRWSEEQMDKTANEIHNHFMRMHTSIFDMALRECIDNNGVKIFFDDYSHLRDYELDTLKNDFIMKGVYA